MQETKEHLIRGLGPIAAISINVGNIIGTGIFLKARVMTCNVGTPWRVIGVWIAAGLLALAGALTYAELTTMRPHAGAEYVITKDAYGRVWGFLNGWSQILVSRTASAAALSVGFAIFMNDLLGGTLGAVYFQIPLPGGYQVPFGTLQVVALVTLAVTTLINCAAVSVSGHVSTVITILKVLVVLGVGIGAFFYQAGTLSHLGMANIGGTCQDVAVTGGGFSGFFAAMLGALWAYDGWNNISYMAGEVKHPDRNLPLALIASMIIVIRTLCGGKRQLLLRADTDRGRQCFHGFVCSGRSDEESVGSLGGKFDSSRDDAFILGLTSDVNPWNRTHSFCNGPRRTLFSKPGEGFSEYEGTGDFTRRAGRLGGNFGSVRFV